MPRSQDSSEKESMQVCSGRLPDMIIGGAPRCGTSWLYELTDRHPQIEMAKPRRPEPKFFLDDYIYARGLDYYSRTWFRGIDKEKIAGEKSTNYLENAEVPVRIRRDIPSVKLIFVLRNPVERAYSNYCWTQANGLEKERFDDALELELSGDRKTPNEFRYARPFSYLERGLYRKLLQPFFDRFPRNQILCLRFEDIVENQRDLTRRFYEFLGVSFRPKDAEQLGVVNAVATENVSPMSPETRGRLKQFYERPNRELANLLGDGFRMWWS